MQDLRFRVLRILGLGFRVPGLGLNCNAARKECYVHNGESDGKEDRT